MNHLWLLFIRNFTTWPSFTHQKLQKIMDATKGRRPTTKMPPQTQKLTQQGHGNLQRRSRNTAATNFTNATHSATYDRLYREKQDHVFPTLRRHNFLMAPVEKLPSGNHNLLAETFRKWYGSTIFVSMEYAPWRHYNVPIRAQQNKLDPLKYHISCWHIYRDRI